MSLILNYIALTTGHRVAKLEMLVDSLRRTVLLYDIFSIAVFKSSIDI